MNLHSIKSRFIGNYFFLMLLFVVQLPIIYMLVGGMNKKYDQVEEAGALRKRAVELNYILSRHIMNGEEELEQVFQDLKKEFGVKVDGLKNGTDVIPAVSGDQLPYFQALDQKWQVFNSSMDAAMESGDNLHVMLYDFEEATYPMIDSLDDMAASFMSLRDPAYSKSIDMIGTQKMRIVNVAYLMERYTRTNDEMESLLASIKATVSDFEETLKGLRHGSASLGLKPVTNKELLSKFDDLERAWYERKNILFSITKEKDTFYVRMVELANNLTPALVASADDLTKQLSSGAKASARNGILIMAVAIILSLILAVFFLWATNHHIIKPIIRVKETVESFTHGDLTKRADIKIKFLGIELNDEIKSLGSSVDEMAVQMSRMIGRISDSSNLLASASEQLSASSTQIAEGADRQSNQTAHVATAMEEMNATVIEVAKNSQQVAESARGAQNIAKKGGEVVIQAITAMKEVAESTSVTSDTIKILGKSSEEIGTIVSVINDIADQTNLLALNAAIEAARAGEQGRGFAVVADEVRKLAERTTKATKEISGMIKTIQGETGKAVNAMSEGTRKVENGVRLGNEAGDALQKIVTGVENVTDMISHIATSAEEQSSTTDEITRNMDSIAEVAKSNVNAIGEVANATNELARLATELKEIISRFKVEGSTTEVAEVKVLPTSGKTKGGQTAEVRFLKASGDA